MDVKGKKLLIIGGAFQHCKIIESAKRMDVETYVVDYLPVEKSPGKLIADHHYQYNITDYAEIEALCKKEAINGAIALCLDACQRPYQHICEIMDFPCFGTKEQFYKLTDKNAFKKACKESGVDIIPEYGIECFADEETCHRNVDFPIFVKPCDSRGSRGQEICFNYQQVKEAIEAASRESSTGEVVIEKYMGGKEDFSVSYVVIDGVPHLTRTGSRFLGKKEDGLDRLCIAGISPSKHTDLYLEKVEKHVIQLINDIGLINAPFFLQGFVDGDTVRFYDPGLRFPGIEYERMYERITGINPIEALIEYALTGVISSKYQKLAGTALLGGNIAVDLLIAIRPGTITAIEGWNEVLKMPEVISGFAKYQTGASIADYHNVNQRFCEIDLVCSNTDEAKRVITYVYDTLRVLDVDGKDMKTSLLDVSLIG